MIHWIINHIKAHTFFCLTSCGYQFRIYLCYNYGYYYSLEPLIKVVLFWIDNNSQFEEDELLARAIQECLNVESPLISDNGNKYQPAPVYYSMGICVGCQTEIGFGRYLNCLNGFWHPKCFRYRACNLTITDYELNFFSNTNANRETIFQQTMLVLLNIRGIPFGSRNICPLHEHDGPPRCCSSERIELCLECLDSAIMDTSECQPLFLDIQEFYEGLNMKLEQQVLLLLVERQALNEAREGERNGHYHMPETRGLCLFEEQTISTISRCPRFGARNRATYMKIEPYKLTCHCEVTAILILYGLPRCCETFVDQMTKWLNQAKMSRCSLRKVIRSSLNCPVSADPILQVFPGSSSKSGTSVNSSTGSPCCSATGSLGSSSSNFLTSFIFTSIVPIIIELTQWTPSLR
ncbi:hypothetical protein UlMin_023582 [Ulmus minor]